MTSAILWLALLGAVGPDVDATEKRETFLYVATSPPGAEVLVDGKRVGTTPGLFPFKPGPSRVIVELVGHDQHGEIVTIRAGDIKRLKLRLKRQAAAKVDNQTLGPGASLDSILARLKRPPKGWKVLESLTKSADELADADDELAGRVEHVSRIFLSRRGKTILVVVCQSAPGEDLEKIRDAALRSAVNVSCSQRIHPPACLTYGRTILTFQVAAKVDPAFSDEAIRELGFMEESRLPLWADLAKQHELRKKNHVQLVVGKERMTLEGKPATWEDLRTMLERLSDRENTVLYIARTTDDWIIAAWQEVEDRLRGAHRDLGFESTSFIGVRSLGYQATRSLRLVIAGKEYMVLNGRELKQSELFDELLNVSDRYRTVLEICRATGGSQTMKIHEWNRLHGHAATIANQLGFKGTTYTGEHPLGSRASMALAGLYVGDPIPAHDVELNFAELGIRDSSFHGKQSVAFPLNLDSPGGASEKKSHYQLRIGSGVWDLSVEVKDQWYLNIQTEPGGKVRAQATSPASGPFRKIIPIPLRLGGPELPCPVQIELERDSAGKVTGHYWFCAYLSGSLPSPSGQRRFEVVSLDPQMKFRDVVEGDKPDALLGVDVNGDGKIDPSLEGKERFGLHEPFQIGSRRYVVVEVNRFVPRVVFREIASSADLAVTEEQTPPAATPAMPGRQAMPDGTNSSAEPAPEINEAIELIEQSYYVGLDRSDLKEAAIRGMVKELDMHADFLTQTELASLEEQVPEKLSGIGLALRFEKSTGELRVETPLPKMPAYRAGIRAGDSIVQIDGKPASQFPPKKQLQTAVTLIRGKPGSAVTIGVKRSGSDQVEQIEIVREAIRMPAVTGDGREPDGDWDFMLDHDRKIGYVRLMHFNSHSADELGDVVEELQSKGMEALILDLRNNAGGLLSQAIQVADLFVDDGVIVSVKDRQEPGRSWFAKRPGTLGEFPMVVLVNRDSVAAAEIVAACLQDHERAIIVGERTYGKGTAHRILKFEDGGGALKLPTALFHRPNGKGIHRFDGAEAMDTWGVLPDEQCEVSLSTEEYGRFLDYRRQRDVFSPEGPPATDFVDRQLQTAIERL